MSTQNLLLIGQSNASGPHGDPLIGPFGVARCHNGIADPAGAPIKGLSGFDSIPPAAPGYYSLEGGLLKQTAKNPDRMWNITKYAVGGSSAQEWLDTHLTAAIAAAANSPWAGQFTSCAIFQGERDSKVTEDQAGYPARYASLVSQVRTAFPGILVVSFLTNSDVADGTIRTTATVDAIRAGQIASGVDATIDTTGYPTVDGLHFAGAVFATLAELFDSKITELGG